MARYIPDDRRYETFEMRAAYDPRYVIKEPKAKAVKVKGPKVVDHAGRTCTIGPFAVSGRRCGEPAVFAFEATTGEIFAECATHHPTTK